MLTDYAALAPERRNLLRLLFGDPCVRTKMPDWESDARNAVATFRLEAARAGASGNVGALVDELSRLSPEFAAMWRDGDVRTHGEGTKHLRRPGVDLITLEYSAFAVDGHPNLSLVIYTPATLADLERVRLLVRGQI